MVYTSELRNEDQGNTAQVSWVSTIGALAAYTTVEGDLLGETAVIAGALAAACLASVAIWAAFGAAIAGFLERPGTRRAFNWSMAGLLALSLIPVFW